jgi:uncharacterized protein (TIRG00374 family)
MKYFKYLRIAILFFVVLIIVYPRIKASYHEIPLLFGEANKGLFLFLALFQVGSYFGDGWLCRVIFEMANLKVKFSNILRVAVLDTFGNQIAPLVGATGITYFFYRKLKIPSGTILFLITTFAIFTFLSHFLFFLVSLIFLPKAFLNLIPVEIGPFIAAILIIFFVFIFIVLKNRGEIFANILRFFGKLINKIGGRFKKNFLVDEEKIKGFVNNFYQCFVILSKNKIKIPQALFAASVFYLSDILTLYFSFLVFGFHPNFAMMIFGYTISLLLGLLTFVPEDPGVMESSLTLSFVAIGFPVHISLFSSLLFRLFSYWLPLPLGILSYFSLKKKNVV